MMRQHVARIILYNDKSMIKKRLFFFVTTFKKLNSKLKNDLSQLKNNK